MESNRILLYGASNLWLSRKAALQELRRRFSGYLQIGLAAGPGRSYGLNAGNPLIHYEALKDVFFEFPQECDGKRLALITDIGNDIAYSQDPKRVILWVEGLVEKLRASGFEIIVGGIPVKSLATLNPFLFKTLARLYYPDGSVSKEQVTEQLFQLEELLLEFCQSQKLQHVPLNAEWYSIDRFHLKSQAKLPYWQSLLDNFEVCNKEKVKNWPLSITLEPRRYWVRGQEKRGQERYGNLIPHSITVVR